MIADFHISQSSNCKFQFVELMLFSIKKKNLPFLQIFALLNLNVDILNEKVKDTMRFQTLSLF